MPILAPNIYYFDNNSQEKVPYTKISADYDSKKMNCRLTNPNSKVRLFQKKWILRSFDKKREIETDSDFIDFSLAQKFPNIICETILSDGLLYKKEQVVENFSSFESWPNISPGMRKYTASSIVEFSISDYFKTKEAKQYYFCESGAEDISEKRFCSLIDRDTGGIDDKNSKSKKILQLIGNEKYKIFNLTIGTKQENKIVSQTGVQFLLYNMSNNYEYTEIPPEIEFKNSVFSKYFMCQSNLFLYVPNNKNIAWTKNEKKISEVTDKILSQKYIEYGQSYKCANNNGESEKFIIDKNYLEIEGPTQISFESNNLSKIVHYETNLNLPEGKFSWSCQASNNIQCNIIESSEIPGYQIKITPNEKFRKSFLHEKIKIILNVNNEIFEKEVVIFNDEEHESVTDDISDQLSITVGESDNLFTCNIPELIQKSSMINIYWFIDSNEAHFYRNKTELNKVINKDYVTCIVVGKLLNKNIIGAASYLLEDPNKKNPSWLKDIYLVNLEDNKKRYLFTKNSETHLNNVYCYITAEENSYKLTKNLCSKDSKSDIFLNLNEDDIKLIKSYLFDSQIIDVFNIPYFTLNIRIFENGKLRNLKSKIKFFIPNQKPIIYAAGVFESKNNNQKCFVIVKDPQNLFLSSQFNLEKNRIVKNISSFNYQDNNENMENFGIIKLLKKKNIYYYEYDFKFNYKEDFCNVMVGNGTTISQIRTPKSSEGVLKKLLVSINNKTQKESSFVNKNYHINEHLLKKDFSVNDNKVIISLHKSTISHPSNPFLLKFFYKNKESHLDIAYSQLKYLQSFSQLPSQGSEVEYDPYNENDYSGTFFGYFLSSRVFKKNNETNKDYVCEARPWQYANEMQLFKYSIFLNDNLLFSRQLSKDNISFEVKNVKHTDTITCQVELGNKIESSSYTYLDNTKLASYCYALDHNYSVLSFECPSNVSIQQTSDELKKNLADKLVSQFKILDNVTYAHMILWTQSQKNKISITTKIDEDLNRKY